MVDDTIPQERCDFYVYVIFRPTGEPCYVGKGKGGRWQQHIKKSHNIRLRRIVAQAQRYGWDIPIVKVRDGLTDKQACQIETALISAIGRDDLGLGPLVNLTNGGDGTSGHIPTEETRNKKRIALTGRKRPPEIGEAVRRAAAWDRPEWREKQRAAHLGHEATMERKLSQSVSLLRRRGRTVDDIGSDGLPLTKFQRILINKPVMTREEISAAQSLRNMGNEHGLGNKRTPEGQARVTESVVETNKRRNKSGKPAVWKDIQTPWVELGMSRTSWFRERAKARNEDAAE